MRLRLLLSCLVLAALCACSSAPSKRISPPGVRVSQLQVQADGQWELQLRLHNNSGMAMRFDQVRLELRSGEQLLASIDARPALSVGAESGDTHVLTVTPDAQARLLVAGVLADGSALPYQLRGQATAAPVDGRGRDYPLNFSSTLYPAPGLPGVLR